MYLLISGDAYNGWSIIGPFTSGDEARRYKRDFRLKETRVAKVKPPSPDWKPRPNSLTLRPLSNGHGGLLP